MLIPEAAAVYVENQEEWKALVSFLKQNDCLAGDSRSDPETIPVPKVWGDGALNAIRICGNQFWRGMKRHYENTCPSVYDADPAWWCISGYEFIARHEGASNSDDSFGDDILLDIM